MNETPVKTINSQRNEAEDAFVEAFASSTKGDRRGMSRAEPKTEPTAEAETIAEALNEVEGPEVTAIAGDATPDDPEHSEASEPAEHPADADSAGATDDSANDGEGEEDPARLEAAQATFDEAFTKAMQEQGADISLDDLPADAKPLVAKKLKNLEAGFTRTMQQVRAVEREAQQVRAEVRFQRERPVDFVVTLLQANPDIAAQVNARLDEFEKSPTAKEYHAVIVEQARAAALQAEEAEATEQQHRAERATQIEMTARAAAEAAGVPFEMGVEDAIVAHLLSHGDIEDSDIKRIAQQKAAIWHAQQRGQKRTERKEYVAQKVQDRKTAGLKLVPGRGAAPAPAPRPAPKNDDEFVEQMAARLR